MIVTLPFLMMRDIEYVYKTNFSSSPILAGELVQPGAKNMCEKNDLPNLHGSTLLPCLTRCQRHKVSITINRDA